METVVNHLHSRSSHQENIKPSPSRNRSIHPPTHVKPKESIKNRSPKTYTESRVRTKARYDRDQSDSSSSSEGEDREEPRQFYLSSASEDEGEEDMTHLVQGEDHRRSGGPSHPTRKNVYGGSHSSRASSFRSSGGSLSPKSKRRGGTRSPSPPPSRRRYISHLVFTIKD